MAGTETTASSIPVVFSLLTDYPNIQVSAIFSDFGSGIIFFIIGYVTFPSNLVRVVFPYDKSEVINL